MSSRFTQGHACVIGIGGDLPSTVNDAEGLASILIDPERCAYPPEQVHLLTGDRATRKNILQTLETLATTTDDDATVLIYFSGHGYQLTGVVDTYYFMPHGYDAEKLSTTAISGAAFVDLLREIPAKKLLVLLDCCHAGGLIDLSEFRTEKAPLPPEAERMFARGGGRIIIGSSKAQELSYAGEPYSAFTRALIRGLCGEGATAEDGYIRAADLAMYVSRTVSQLTADEQHPVLDIEKADNFILSYYSGGDSQKKPLPADVAGSANIESFPGQIDEQAQASNDRSISIGGDVTGSNIIFGDGNYIRSTHVTQSGKYNINMDTARGIRIGDSYGSPFEEEDWQPSRTPKGIGKSSGEQKIVEVPIFFATDREQRNTASVRTFYGGKRSFAGRTDYGIAKVSIPEDRHTMGEIERPKWWKLQLREDPQEHVVLAEIQVLEQGLFVDTLRSAVTVAQEPDLLLFIHGYNTSFADAAMRTAQITYDLQFPGPAILYSWPSGAELQMYAADENNAEWTLPHFESFLALLMSAVNARKINAIAHSMGNRILTRAVDELDYSILPEGAATLRNIIFAAPDIDADTFRQFAKRFQKKADRLTLYASSKDKALVASKVVHGGYPRAGDSGEDLVVVEGLDTIDASDVDTSLLGHAYFGDNRSIISDIFYLIRHNLPPNLRSGLKASQLRELPYWCFRS